MKILPLDDKTMDVRELIRRVKRARDQVVLTRHGRPVLVVQDAAGCDRETIALSTNADFARFINQRRQEAKEYGTVSFNDVCKEFDLPPLEQRRRPRRSRLSKKAKVATR